MRSMAPIRTKAKLRPAAIHMAVIETKPEKIKVFFKDPIVAYAD